MRLWNLFLLFQQASADAMLVEKQRLYLFGIGWGRGAGSPWALLTGGWGPADCVQNTAGLLKSSVLMGCFPHSCSSWDFFISAYWCFWVSGTHARTDRRQKGNAGNSLLAFLQVPFFSPPLRAMLALKFPAGGMGKMCPLHLIQDEKSSIIFKTVKGPQDQNLEKCCSKTGLY